MTHLTGNPKDGGFAPTGAVYKKTEDADLVKGKEYYTDI